MNSTSISRSASRPAAASHGAKSTKRKRGHPMHRKLLSKPSTRTSATEPFSMAEEGMAHATSQPYHRILSVLSFRSVDPEPAREAHEHGDSGNDEGGNCGRLGTLKAAEAKRFLASMEASLSLNDAGVEEEGDVLMGNEEAGAAALSPSKGRRDNSSINPSQHRCGSSTMHPAQCGIRHSTCVLSLPFLSVVEMRGIYDVLDVDRDGMVTASDLASFITLHQSCIMPLPQLRREEEEKKRAMSNSTTKTEHKNRESVAQPTQDESCRRENDNREERRTGYTQELLHFVSLLMNLTVCVALGHRLGPCLRVPVVSPLFNSNINVTTELFVLSSQEMSDEEVGCEGEDDSILFRPVTSTPEYLSCGAISALYVELRVIASSLYQAYQHQGQASHYTYGDAQVSASSQDDATVLKERVMLLMRARLLFLLALRLFRCERASGVASPRAQTPRRGTLPVSAAFLGTRVVQSGRSGGAREIAACDIAGTDLLDFAGVTPALRWRMFGCPVSHETLTADELSTVHSPTSGVTDFLITRLVVLYRSVQRYTAGLLLSHFLPCRSESRSDAPSITLTAYAHRAEVAAMFSSAGLLGDGNETDNFCFDPFCRRRSRHGSITPRPTTLSRRVQEEVQDDVELIDGWLPARLRHSTHALELLPYSPLFARDGVRKWAHTLRARKARVRHLRGMTVAAGTLILFASSMAIWMLLVPVPAIVLSLLPLITLLLVLSYPTLLHMCVACAACTFELLLTLSSLSSSDASPLAHTSRYLIDRDGVQRCLEEHTRGALMGQETARRGSARSLTQRHHNHSLSASAGATVGHQSSSSPEVRAELLLSLGTRLHYRRCHEALSSVVTALVGGGNSNHTKTRGLSSAVLVARQCAFAEWMAMDLLESFYGTVVAAPGPSQSSSAAADTHVKLFRLPTHVLVDMCRIAALLKGFTASMRRDKDEWAALPVDTFLNAICAHLFVPSFTVRPPMTAFSEKRERSEDGLCASFTGFAEAVDVLAGNDSLLVDAVNHAFSAAERVSAALAKVSDSIAADVVGAVDVEVADRSVEDLGEVLMTAEDELDACVRDVLPWLLGSCKDGAAAAVKQTRPLSCHDRSVLGLPRSGECVRLNDDADTKDEYLEQVSDVVEVAVHADVVDVVLTEVSAMSSSEKNLLAVLGMQLLVLLLVLPNGERPSSSLSSSLLQSQEGCPLSVTLPSLLLVCRLLQATRARSFFSDYWQETRGRGKKEGEADIGDIALERSRTYAWLRTLEEHLRVCSELQTAPSTAYSLEGVQACASVASLRQYLKLP